MFLLRMFFEPLSLPHIASTPALSGRSPNMTFVCRHLHHNYFPFASKTLWFGCIWNHPLLKTSSSWIYWRFASMHLKRDGTFRHILLWNRRIYHLDEIFYQRKSSSDILSKWDTTTWCNRHHHLCNLENLQEKHPNLAQ